MLRKHQQSVIRLVFGNFTSLKSRIAFQVARKIAPCNMALTLTGIPRNVSYWTSRENSLELIELSSINKVSSVYIGFLLYY
jgi:hypothetical protein